MLPLHDAAEFRRRLIKDVYPELKLYLADDAMAVLAQSLGATAEECGARFDRKEARSGGVAGSGTSFGAKQAGRTGGGTIRSSCAASGTGWQPCIVTWIWRPILQGAKVAIGCATGSSRPAWRR
jgi:hypothetical protein